MPSENTTVENSEDLTPFEYALTKPFLLGDFPNMITKEIVEKVYKGYPHVIRFIPKEKLSEVLTEDLLLKIAKVNGAILEHVPHFMMTEELVKVCVNNYGLALKHARHDLKTKEVVMIALKNDGMAARYTPKYMFDYDVKNAAREQNCNSCVFF